MNSKNVSILFGDWLSAHYDPDNGVGYWIDYDEHNTIYTTEQLWEIFKNTELRKLKINKLNEHKS